MQMDLLFSSLIGIDRFTLFFFPILLFPLPRKINKPCVSRGLIRSQIGEASGARIFGRSPLSVLFMCRYLAEQGGGEEVDEKFSSVFNVSVKFDSRSSRDFPPRIRSPIFFFFFYFRKSFRVSFPDFATPRLFRYREQKAIKRSSTKYRGKFRLAPRNFPSRSCPIC